MELDIRLPIGLMFSMLGPLLVITGIVQETSLNIETGAAMIVFGGFMFTFGLLAHRRAANRVSSRAAQRIQTGGDHRVSPSIGRSKVFPETSRTYLDRE